MCVLLSISTDSQVELELTGGGGLGCVRRGRDRMVVVFNLHVQSVPITTHVVRSNPTHTLSTIKPNQINELRGMYK
jgi:hypothetical protein